MKKKLLIFLFTNFCFGQTISFDELLSVAKMNLTQVELFALDKGFNFYFAENDGFDEETQYYNYIGNDFDTASEIFIYTYSKNHIYRNAGILFKDQASYKKFLQEILKRNLKLVSTESEDLNLSRIYRDSKFFYKLVVSSDKNNPSIKMYGLVIGIE